MLLLWSALQAMSWGPLFDLETLEAFKSNINDHPQGAGRGGLQCPTSLIDRGANEFGYSVLDSRTTGNCGVLAFTTSAINQGVRPSWKRMSEQKRCSEARKMGCEWASKNQSKKVWGGWTIREIAEAVSSQRFDKWGGRLRLADTWPDAAFIHCLCCCFGLDGLLVTSNGPARLVGQSLMVGDHECGNGLVPMAWHEHHHFWPLIPEGCDPLGKVDMVVGPGQVQMSEKDTDFDEVEPAECALASREQELQLCEVLSSWAPFDAPSVDIVQSMQTLGFIGTWIRTYNAIHVFILGSREFMVRQ